MLHLKACELPMSHASSCYLSLTPAWGLIQQTVALSMIVPPPFYLSLMSACCFNSSACELPRDGSSGILLACGLSLTGAWWLIPTASEFLHSNSCYLLLMRGWWFNFTASKSFRNGSSGLLPVYKLSLTWAWRFNPTASEFFRVGFCRAVFCR